MKCLKCGAEIESGLIYCPKCGESIQLVPEYNVLEEELLSKVVEDKTKSKDGKFADGVYSNPEPSINITINGDRTKKYSISKKIIIIMILVISLILIGGISTIAYYNYTHTYEYRMMLANEAEEKSQYTLALEYYNEAVSLDNSSFDALYGLGRMYYQTKNYEEAITELTLALALDPENEDIYSYLLNCYQQLDDVEGINSLAENAPNDEILELISEYLVLPPSFSLDGGEYHSKITLYLTSSNDYDIYYTINGKNPVNSGKKYTGSIVLEDGETTVKAVCVNSKGEYSDVVSETYTITDTTSTIPTPTVSPVDGIYYEKIMITIDVPEGYYAYYTWDGTDPSENGILYTEPFPILEGASVLWVVYMDSSGNCSEVPYIANYVYISN